MKPQSLPQDNAAPDISPRWALLALLSHTGWGLYPVFARYLQAVSGLPGLSILAVGNLLVLALLARPLLGSLRFEMLRAPLLWAFAFAVVGRAITNVLAARYALATYVQLVALSTPFLVVLLGRTFFREPIPRHTFTAVSLTVIGSLLLLSSGDNPLSLVQLAPSSADWLGMLLAFISSTFLSFYMLFMRRSAQQAVRGETMFGVQLLALIIVNTPLSLLVGEDWGQWLRITPFDWLIFLLFTFGVLLGANISNIIALRHLGAPFVSSLLGWRMVITIGVSWVLLGETLSTVWQVLGAVVVVGAVTWYVSTTARRRSAPPPTGASP